MKPELKKILEILKRTAPSSRIAYRANKPDGALIDIVIGSEMFVIEWRLTQGYGISRLTSNTQPFAGHDEAFNEWGDAEIYLSKLIYKHCEIKVAGPKISTPRAVAG